jgi:hypothetical protein
MFSRGMLNIQFLGIKTQTLLWSAFKMTKTVTDASQENEISRVVK